jgi:hypothetical protein
VICPFRLINSSLVFVIHLLVCQPIYQIVF